MVSVEPAIHFGGMDEGVHVLSVHLLARRSSAVFTAEDQRYTYEVKKAPIDQKRSLCDSCWKRSNQIAGELMQIERAWTETKPTLRIDRPFLERWLLLLNERDEYVAYRSDTAKKNMLNRLLRDA